ncbi:hypothetical protein M3610_16350 [Neobacillus sp. MER 74]|nr:hypothetical protein [Neobacillus sp. MER 74]MCM3116850.1 hypothetical protein [Neobacillus sp. MER 74]
MDKKKKRTFAEMAEAGKKVKGIKVEYINEPNIKLIAEAAINLYHDNF